MLSAQEVNVFVPFVAMVVAGTLQSGKSGGTEGYSKYILSLFRNSLVTICAFLLPL
jgi:hypothetical protein